MFNKETFKRDTSIIIEGLPQIESENNTSDSSLEELFT